MTRTTAMGPRPQRALIALAILGLALAAALGVYVYVQSILAFPYSDVSRRTQDAWSEIQDRASRVEYDRPPLRGEPADGNVYERVRTAMRGISYYGPMLTEESELRDDVPALEDLLARDSARIAAIRDALQATHVQRQADGIDERNADVVAALALDASVRPAGECLVELADAERAALDMGVDTEGPPMTLVLRVAERCAAQASPAELAAAARLFDAVDAGAPPLRPNVERSLIHEAYGYLWGAPRFDWKSPIGWLFAMRNRRAAYTQALAVLDRLEVHRTRYATRSTHCLPRCFDDAGATLPQEQRLIDMRDLHLWEQLAVAHVRLVAAMLHLAAGEAEREVLEQRLDPFTGASAAPFRVRRDGARRVLAAQGIDSIDGEIGALEVALVR